MRSVLPPRISSTQTGAGSTTIMQKMCGEKTSLIIGCRFREQELGEEDEQNDVLQDAKKAGG